MPRKKRIITFENITELKQSDLKKIEEICFKIAKRYSKVYCNTRKNLELYYYNMYGKKSIYATCIHWSVGSGVGIIFAIECTGNLLNPKDWNFRTCENANYPQMNSIIYTLGSPYNFNDIGKIIVKEECSEIMYRGSHKKEAK